MISYSCPVCGQTSFSDESQAGNEVLCGGCGTPTVVPIELDCEDGPAAPEAQTITVAELRALRLGLR